MWLHRCIRTQKHRRSVEVDMRVSWKNKCWSYREQKEENESAEHVSFQLMCIHRKQLSVSLTF